MKKDTKSEPVKLSGQMERERTSKNNWFHWLVRQWDKWPDADGLIGNQDSFGKWRVVYSDGLRSQRMVWRVANSYARMFRGQVIHVRWERNEKSMNELDSTKLRIRVAELCGWEQITPSEVIGGNYIGQWNGSDDKFLIPDYPNDLNAMHEAENTLLTGASGELKREWLQYLRKAATLGGTSAESATASQRAVALVATVEANSVPKA